MAHDAATPKLAPVFHRASALLDPIQGELYGMERLEQFAPVLAGGHRIRPGRHRGRPMLARLRDNQAALLQAWQEVAATAESGQPISPAAEWLYENFQVVEDQLREIVEDLPPRFYLELPKLAEGPFADYPRVYALAWAYVEHTDSRFEEEHLRRFVVAYQAVQPLTLGELWAIAISLRLVLVENLRRVADVIVHRRAARRQADALADAMLDPARGHDAAVQATLAALEGAPLRTAFAVQLIQRLRDCDPAQTPGLVWLHERLALQRTNAEDVVRREHLKQVAMQGPVRDTITSMRKLSQVDWGDFVEGVSLVEAELRNGTRVADYDFATRDRYRHSVEDLARRSERTELQIARLVTAKARGTGSSRDPGHFLIDGKRWEIEAEIGYAPTWNKRARRVMRTAPAYLLAIALVTAAALGAAGLAASWRGAGPIEIGILSLLALLPASELAIALVHLVVTRIVPPRKLPKLALEEGVPPELRTLVAIPTLLTRESEIRELVGRLEVHHLANDDGDLHFALVTDWGDADAERTDRDDALLAIATDAIADLNAQHGPAPSGAPRFLLLHRDRRWCPAEGRWMGWERKRGKLRELNRLLRGATDTSFHVSIGAEPAELARLDFRYVITLDSDTRLPRGAAKRLVGAIAHPMNRPVHDASGRVVQGYGVLQPRITPTLPETGEGTLAQRIFSGPAGIDPYAFAVSDVYQDLFGEGSFVGKGVYDIDAFERALDDRVPENALLSHDLFEGLFARAGLLSDVELFESVPAHYQVSASRQHRWARGDWQLLPWIGAPDVTPIGRWKVVDNLRRTLVAPASLATLVASWFLPDGRPWIWTLFLLGAFAIPVLLPLSLQLLPRRRGLAKASFARGVGHDLRLGAMRLMLGIALLPEHALQMTDAVTRTLYRLVVRRKMLEWVTAAQAEAGARLGFGVFYRQMAPAVGLSAAVFVAVAALAPHALGLASPFVALWLVSPAIAHWISVPPAPPARARLDAGRAAFLRLTARRTWRYFETYVTAGDQFLPPDNYQEDPPALAHRTSPTNMGLYVLSTVSAHDMGWIGTGDLVERLEATFRTFARLERHRGHVLNWYDTVSLAPLYPRYVSTVDSGNLAGHLLTLHQACLEIAAMPPASPKAADGIRDALAVCREAIATNRDDRRGGAVVRRQLEEAAEEIAALLNAVDAPGAWEAMASRAAVLVDIAEALVNERGDAMYGSTLDWARAVREGVASHAADRGLGDDALRARLLALSAAAEELARGMDWSLLFDPARKLFAIGFNVESGVVDPYHYDLLASEARLASFLAIAEGDVPASHWFSLGRRHTPIGFGSALVSWSGSMFEYLMPELVMAVPEGSLIAQTNRKVVEAQVRYGADRGLPWGVSESAYHTRDLHLTYQYSNFGVPGLGMKPGLGADAVVAPYASALAAMVEPVVSADNLRRLERIGALGRFGFYESIDYTAARMPDDTKFMVVRAYMAHHQGMSVVAIVNLLGGYAMRRRFHAVPMVRATELLLHERTPRNIAAPLARIEDTIHRHVREVVPPVLRHFRSPHDATPATHRLSNGRYSVAVTAAGSGRSQWGDLAVNRWREDHTLDAYGSFVYLRDTESGEVWSATWQPTAVEPTEYEASFFEHRVEIKRRDGTIGCQLDVVVVPREDTEVRQVTLTNHGHHPRTIELTSYMEVVLAPLAADVSHPAFSNLFVQTEFDPSQEALLATRRTRSPGDPKVWAAHISRVHGANPAGVQFETDRARFLGRGRGVRNASAVQHGRPLSNTVGPVLDPIFSLRRRVTIQPGRSVCVVFVTLLGSTRDAVLDRCDGWGDPLAFDRTLNEAWTHAQIQLHHLGIEPEEAQLYQRLGSRAHALDPAMRARKEVLQRSRRGQSALWRFGISGDIPIVLASVGEMEDKEIVRQLVHARCYLQLKGLMLDLVFINEQSHTYQQDLQTSFEGLVRASQLAGLHNGVHLVRADQLSSADHDLLLATARVVLHPRDGSLYEQVTRLMGQAPAPRPPQAIAPIQPAIEVAPPRLDLEMFNGVGGFSKEDGAYVVVLGARQWTPLPWINVIANPTIGFLVSESGGGFTWAGNSHENQLTPWSNDPVSDPPGEVLYLRDEDSGEVWTATPLPVREDTPYVVKHDQGSTTFTHESHGIALELVMFVASDDPVKLSRLTVRNLSGRPRQLSVAAYIEWVLGPARASTAPHVVTTLDPQTKALFARSAWRDEFAGKVAFFDIGGDQLSWTADRADFLGRNGSLSAPAALGRPVPGARRVGPGLDPCGMMWRPMTLGVGEEAVVVVALGQGEDEGHARDLVRRYRQEAPAAVLEQVEAQWDGLLNTIRIRTPEPAMDLLMNRWLLYQVLSCRVWARAAFYQAGGAFGFRDQLQDVMALFVSRPDLAREQILRASSRQFLEGDVQHWWHPPAGKGVRTRFSDDRVWLPYVTSHYIDATGDLAVLDEETPFLEADLLAPGQEDAYGEPRISAQVGTVYEHSARALDISLAVGRNGLPLMGAGDWNDGMNRVGMHGEGQSVWLAWFLIATLDRWIPIAEARGDSWRVAAWKAHTSALRQAVEAEAWDGDWYRRAYMDDGTPLGSAANVEGRIDSIAQSWAVLSGAGRPDRAVQAMASLDEHLVRRADGVVLLLTPPFDKTPIDPGYIKGYLPGIRENGGQYTHAAIWAMMAFAELGDGNKAGELFAMLNPLNRSSTRAGVQRYKVEPYVVAADVYGASVNLGRGGWTWYTGSASWMYRAGLEWLLGVRVRAFHIELAPCIPAAWPGYEASIQLSGTTYEIRVTNPDGAQRGLTSLTLDGAPLDAAAGRIPIVRDGGTHVILAQM